MNKIVFGKTNRLLDPTPVEMINFNKIDSNMESETNG